MRTTKLALVLAAVAAAALAGGCDDDSSPSTPGADTNRTYVQIERLGNPLLSEVTFAKRDHGFHNSTGPSTDAANFTDDLTGFVAAFGRSAMVQNTLASVLLPDELVVDTSKDPATSGWLSWALAAGWGGRNLSDDVVDAACAAVFGNLLDPNNTIPCLTTDSVSANDVAFGTTFPYLAAAH
jgi:hypothetical protein